MIKVESRLTQVKDIINSYSYPKPFSLYLKEYFKKQKKFGSRDRKELRMLCYDFFRTGNAFSLLPFEEKLLISQFLIEEKPDRFTEYLIRNYSIINEEDTSKPLKDKIAKLTSHFPGFSIQNIFPAPEEISEMIDHEKFCLSLLKQPPVWIKIIAAFLQKVTNEFKTAGIEFEEHSKLIFKVNAESKLTETESFKNGYFRIQDLASQETGSYFNPKPGELWWDCCCGAGGKSLALKDSEKDINLYVSDIRPEILRNLKERFLKHKITNYIALVCDLTKESPQDMPMVDNIILDAPCTGSGTWARNPENLAYFDTNTIQTYQDKQIAILDKAFQFLKPGGKLFYITCSVFRKENEDAIEYFCKNHAKCQKTINYIHGYLSGAEIMFLCELKKV